MISSLFLLMSTAGPVGGACGDVKAASVGVTTEMVAMTQGGVEIHRPVSRFNSGTSTKTQGGVTVHSAEPSFDADPCISPSLEGLPKIASNFNRDVEILKDSSPVGKDNDTEGAFRFICQPAHLNWDDPIVYPGQIGGSSHLHQWFGNMEANGRSTYRSLRTSGQTTCMGPLNRSAYWQPAMMTDKGKVVRPDYISIYYKRAPKTAVECGSGGKFCLPLPRGLRYIFGYDMKRMGQSQPENLIFYWKCVTPGNTLIGGLEKRFDKLDCPTGNMLMATIASPECWDGKYLDSSDHRSHILHRKNNPANGRAECPKTHPYILPQFSIGAVYKVGPGENVKDWHLSSDRMPGMPETPPGESFHADWYGAWDDDVLKTWTDNCIDKVLSCSAGQLGDGTIMKRPTGYGLVANPRIVDAPPRPAGAPPMTHPAPPPVSTPPPPVVTPPPADTPALEPSRRRQVKPVTTRQAPPGDMPKTSSVGDSQTRLDGTPKPKHIKVPPEVSGGGKTRSDSEHQRHH